ncbi:MAG TPA: AAA family ATPase [Roseiarcus sp.]|jgi:predicted ATPase
MYFTVLAHGVRTPAHSESRAFLLIDNWDDWFKYNTMYTLIVYDDSGERHSIGSVKIGQFGMEEGQRRAEIPQNFDALDDRFFSLGQDDSYYEALNALGPEERDRILRALKDVSLDVDLFQRALNEKVTGVSLLRAVTPASVQGQFHRMTRGGARLSRYNFSYTAPKPARSRINPVRLEFEVEPESEPPTNIHVLIGRNGVGKTRLLNGMTRALVGAESEDEDVGSFEGTTEDLLDERLFANLVSVTFSAFDPFGPLPSRQDKSSGVQYAYIGLRRTGLGEDGKPHPPRTPDQLSSVFGSSVWLCRQGARASRWRRALEMLEADPIFKDAEVASLAGNDLPEKEFRTRARALFGKLSSGHKIVLLTITRLVETVEERTLVLLDEPEAHLHPPLLSAFVRALSDLLINRNGVGIIATHSPVVLQEVPKSCVWKVRRTNVRVEADRPEIETFGENVGILTREIFGLEVTDSGFHKMLRDAVSDRDTYDEIVEHFGGELGGEAKAIVRALIAAQTTDDDA